MMMEIVDALVTNLERFTEAMSKASSEEIAGCDLSAVRKALSTATDVIQSRPKKSHDDTSQLPTQLRDFPILKEDPSLQEATGKEERSQMMKDLLMNPEDTDIIAKVTAWVEKVTPVYENVVSIRLGENGIVKKCTDVVIVGNRAFRSVYDAVWNLILETEKSGITECQLAIGRFRAAVEIAGAARKQRTSNLVELYCDCCAQKPLFDRLLKSLVSKFNLKHGSTYGDTPAVVRIPEDVKDPLRALEKALLNPINTGDMSKICDVGRAMIEFSEMSMVARMLDEIVADPDFLEVHIKDRFFDDPSAGGWRDVMINLILIRDGKRHVMELQLVHIKLLTARSDLPGHAVYNRVRVACELLEKLTGSPFQAAELVALSTLHAEMLPNGGAIVYHKDFVSSTGS
mmetsp:Transcript_56886/g.77568  ORF Transcript_56886/g.77568 Transcript_56886/m.77568 type:complete len:401 (-) Transcript_56886:826-2028(-)